MHILDLAGRKDFPRILGGFIESSGARVGPKAMHQPKGHEDSYEMQLRQFLPLCHFCAFNNEAVKVLNRWWLKVRPDIARTPQWDLLCECTVDGKDGILLVEAKAHEAELDWGGKQLEPNASKGSCLNHQRIGEAIEEARRSLDAKMHAVNISRDNHYQLGNRVAFSWKLANMGLQVVLLYLGFVGDTGILNVGLPLQDRDHWQRVMGGYMLGVLPLSFPDTRFEFDSGGSMIMLIRSHKVLRPSRALDE